MLIEHQGKRPRIHPTAYVAPTATLSGDVTIGRDTRILFGAVITSDGGPVEIGDECIVMETAVLRGTVRHPLKIGNQVLVGPRAYLTGCTVEDQVFIATGSTIFNGARLKTRSTIRIHGVVHLKTVIPEDGMVPIGWVAVGDPALIRPPKDHDEIWAVQEKLNFPKEVFGIDRPPKGQSTLETIAPRYTKALGRHRDDVIVSSGSDDNS